MFFIEQARFEGLPEQPFDIKLSFKRLGEGTLIDGFCVSVEGRTHFYSSNIPVPNPDVRDNLIDKIVADIIGALAPELSQPETPLPVVEEILQKRHNGV